MIVVVVALLIMATAAFAQGPMNGSGQGSFGRGNGMGFNQGAFGRGNGMGFNQGAFGRGNGMGYNQAGAGYGMGVRLGGPDNSLLALVAERLGLTRTDLIAELQDGQALAEVITAHGGNPEEIVDAFLAARSESLAELVANGQITQEQADEWLATMKENTTARLNEAWTSRGRGNGAGFVDEDGDGVCDNCGAGQGQGRGNGAGFVDEDGDGVCDNYGVGQQGQGRRGGGRMMGQRWQ
jgi:hypothetical protein